MIVTVLSEHEVGFDHVPNRPLGSISVMTFGSFAGIKRLTLFAYLAYGFLCLFARRAGKRALRAILGAYKSFGRTPHFAYYRLASAIALLIRAGP